jgi:DNA invertase Pin-like site-specific DNA recombinase
MPVYGIIRVSTTEQAAEGRTSLDDQRNRVTGAAMTNGWAVDHIYADEGVSGSTPLAERPEGGRMFRALKAGDVVIAAKMDRLFRSAQDALNTVDKFKKAGVKLILVDMGTDPVTENGVSKMLFTVLAAMAEFEKGRILERMADGRKGKKAKGGHTGGQAPYGFRVEGLGRDAVLVEKPGEQVVLSRAKALYASGSSLRGVVQALAREGFVSRSGTPFQATQIMRMVK